MLLTGCGDTEGTAAPPQGTTPGPMSAPSSAPPPVTSGAASPLDGMIGCELITDDDVADIKAGYKITSNSENDGDPYICQWSVSAKAGSAIAFGLVIRPDKGLDQVVVREGWSETAGKVNEQREAKLLKEEREVSESCIVAMAVGPTSRVDVDGNGDKGAACEIVNTLASLVEKKLTEKGL
ncbi:MAG: DUF3558 family protein [Thermocrispum sp.]